MAKQANRRTSNTVGLLGTQRSLLVSVALTSLSWAVGCATRLNDLLDDRGDPPFTASRAEFHGAELRITEPRRFRAEEVGKLTGIYLIYLDDPVAETHITSSILNEELLGFSVWLPITLLEEKPVVLVEIDENGKVESERSAIIEKVTFQEQ